MPNPDPEFRTVAQMWAFYRQVVVQPAGATGRRTENLMRLSYHAGAQDMLRALLAVGSHEDDAVWERALRSWADELNTLAAEMKRFVEGEPR